MFTRSLLTWRIPAACGRSLGLGSNRTPASVGSSRGGVLLSRQQKRQRRPWVQPAQTRTCSEMANLPRQPVVTNQSVRYGNEQHRSVIGKHYNPTHNWRSVFVEANATAFVKCFTETNGLLTRRGNTQQDEDGLIEVINVSRQVTSQRRAFTNRLYPKLVNGFFVRAPADLRPEEFQARHQTTAITPHYIYDRKTRQSRLELKVTRTLCML